MKCKAMAQKHSTCNDICFPLSKHRRIVTEIFYIKKCNVLCLQENYEQKSLVVYVYVNEFPLIII